MSDSDLFAYCQMKVTGGQPVAEDAPLVNAEIPPEDASEMAEALRSIRRGKRREEGRAGPVPDTLKKALEANRRVE